MAITSTVADRVHDMTLGHPGRRRRVVPVLLAALFVVTHAAALAHELEHVFHQHDVPCALHEAAEHLAMVSPPAPPAAVGPAPSPGLMPRPATLVPRPAFRSSGARAPPAS
jgi:hypothetical protein